MVAASMSDCMNSVGGEVPSKLRRSVIQRARHTPSSTRTVNSESSLVVPAPSVLMADSSAVRVCSADRLTPMVVDVFTTRISERKTAGDVKFVRTWESGQVVMDERILGKHTQ